MKHIILFSFILSALFSFSQNNCGTSVYTAKLLADHPEMKPAFRTNQRAKSNDLKTIPVVFHILHEYGSENITDAQVIDAVNILNGHFNMDNPNLQFIDPSFHAIIADCNIEFRLAKKDPQGNCTNGIEHIYTSESSMADDWSKINPWPRNNYLNIWVVSNVAAEGISGYAYPPEMMNDAGLAHLDGIMMLDGYVGSIGTGNSFSTKSLTHEMGHWLGLKHTWGDGEAGIACGDDGIADTPVTKGGYSCMQNSVLCNPGIVENIENFMHTVYCYGMFTPDQADYMHATLESNIAERYNLWQEANLMATGVLDPPGICIPVADFYADPLLTGTNLAVQFKDYSWNSPVTSYEWSFPGGTPSASTDQNPVVTYAAEGFYDAQLIVANSAGSDTLFLDDIVHISPEWSEFFGPASNTFDEPTASWWIIQNTEDENGRFELTPSVGTDGSTCFALHNFYYGPGSPEPETTYYNMLGKTKDALVSPSYHLANTSGVTISLDIAGAFLTADTNKIRSASFKIYTSRDYGRAWTFRKSFNGMQFRTFAAAVTEEYIPQQNEWKHIAFNYTTSSSGDHHTRFKLEYIPADSSNNFYIDNFNVDGVLSVENEQLSHIEIFPNPLGEDQTLTITGLEQGIKSEIIITDVNGSVVKTALAYSESLVLTPTLSAGCYFITINTSNATLTRKIIVG